MEGIALNGKQESRMKNENKKWIMKHLSCVVMLSLMGWSMDAATAEDAAPAPAPAPVVAPVKTDTDIAGEKPMTDTERVKQLATTYGVPEAQVQTMRQTEHMGWGEIKNLLLISQRIVADSAKTETPLTAEQAMAQVLEQRKSGMGIGQIAKSHNVKLGDLENAGKPGKVDKVESIDKPGRPDKVDKVDKPDKPGKPDKVEKVDKPDRPDKPGKGN